MSAARKLLAETIRAERAAVDARAARTAAAEWAAIGPSAGVGGVGPRELSAVIRWALCDLDEAEIAAIANSNARSARNWKEGANLPGAVAMLRLWAGVPRLRASLRRLAQLEADCDPALEAELVAFLRDRMIEAGPR